MRDTLLQELPVSVKNASLNLLVRLEPGERRSPLTIGALRVDRYGGISDGGVCVMLRLFEIYRESSLKQAFQAELSKLDASEFRVVAWYFHALFLLDNIHFAPLDHDTVLSTAQAMRHHRLRLHDSEPIPPYAWDVVLTLCCNKIATLMEQGSYGHKLIAYDSALRMFTCAHKKHGSAAASALAEGAADVLPDDAMDEDVEAHEHDVPPNGAVADASAQATGTDVVRQRIAQFVTNGGDKMAQKRLAADLRKQFAALPCKDQPVLRIPLRGAMLVMGNSNKKKQFYTRCPRCACFHEFDYTRYSGTSGYVCKTCAAQDPTRPEFVSVVKYAYIRCEYCGSTHSCVEKTRIRVMCTDNDPRRPGWTIDMDPRQLLHDIQLCQRCYNIAKRYAWTQPKSDLFRKIEEKRDIFKTRARRGHGDKSIQEQDL
jgi:DNA-directed RNA polymerase subunit RPC12/RpoP